jgi:hypothetical protein
MSGDSTNLKQEFTTELESILESDEAYGSNVQILTYALKEDVINGKFKDSWNNKVYEFIIDADGISYKPAIKLDSFSANEAPVRFDSYSEGYASLFADTRFDEKLIGKRVKKPKCGNSAYGCGFSCIGLQKTCRILSSGKKAGTNQGKAIGKERLNKLRALGDKILGLGDKGALIRASDIKGQITKERAAKANQLREERKEKAKQEQVKAATKPQEKQPAKQIKATKKESVTENETRDFPNRNTQKYYDAIQDVAKNGTLSSETKKDIQDYMKWMHNFPGEVKRYGTEENSKRAVTMKQQRILDEMKNQQPESALGLTAYLHGHPFGKMNGVLWRKDIDRLDSEIAATENRSSDEFTKQYIALDVGAANALRELPSLSREALRERYKDYDIDTEKFHRYMTLPEGDVLDGFLKEHKSGDTIEYHSFQSYTVFKKEDATPNLAQFSKSANVKYTLSRKENTQAKAVDHFKNKAVEGEVLYPPGTKFKISKVEEEQFDKISFFPFKSLSKSKREQKKLSKFIDAIPQQHWDKYVNSLKDEKLKRSLKAIRNKEPDAFGIGLSLYTNNQQTNEKNSLFDVLEKAGVKIDKEPGGKKYHIHMEEI